MASDSMDALDAKCRFCFKSCEKRDYSMARTVNFRTMYKKHGGVLQRAEKEDTVELALPGAFSLDSSDSARSDTSWEKEAALRYAQLDPTCVRFLGLHRIVNPSQRNSLQNWALVAIGTRSNPFPSTWSASGALCEEHLHKLCVPVGEGTDKFRPVDHFQSFACEFCLKRVSSQATANVHKLVSKRAALRLIFREEKRSEELESCAYLEQNFFFRWKCTPFTEHPSLPDKQKPGFHEIECKPRCVVQTSAVMNTQNWASLLLCRARETCKSSPDLKEYAFPDTSSVVDRAVGMLTQHYKGQPPPYLNPEFPQALKRAFQIAIEEDTSTSFPRRKELLERHSDIISTDLAQYCKNDQNHHFLRLDQLKSGSGFYECEATNKQILLDCSHAQIRVEKIARLTATFCDENGEQIVPAMDLLGISDSWLYAEGDPYFRCNGCVCETDRSIVIIEKELEGAFDSKKKFYKYDKWKHMRVIATINGDPFECKVLECISELKIRLDKRIPELDDSKRRSFTLFVECPFHVLAGDLRVKIDAFNESNNKLPIMQLLRGGDYAMYKELPSSNLFSILAIFSQKPNESPSVRQFWKFRISSVLADGPAFHHFWEHNGSSPTLTQPWKSSSHLPKGNNFCIMPPRVNSTFINEVDEFEVGTCYYYSDPVCKSHCSIVNGNCMVCLDTPREPTWLQARRDLSDFIALVDCVADAGLMKWGLHFELDSIVSPSHNSPPQGGVMFVSIPANLGKVQTFPSQVLGFVGTSSPVLSIDIIERDFASKETFVNGFRETFESLLVSCLDGRICIVTSPRVPTYDTSFFDPNPAPPAGALFPQAASVSVSSPNKYVDELKSIDALNSYLRDQLQDSSHQVALVNGCVIDYILRADFGSPLSIKDAICPKVGNPGSPAPHGIADTLLKYLEYSISRVPEPKKLISRCQMLAACQKKNSLDLLLIQKLFLILLNENSKVKKDKVSLHPICGAVSSAINQAEAKIAQVFFDSFMEILQLQQAKASSWGPSDSTIITASNYNHFLLAFRDPRNNFRCSMEEMKQTLLAIRNKVAASLGYPNSIADLTRGDLYFLQSIRDDYSPMQCPSVSPQFMTELLSPVTGLSRINSHAKSVHFLGSGDDGSLHLLALIQRNVSHRWVSYVMWYSLKIPELQYRPGFDFLSAWLPHHIFLIKIRAHSQTSGLIQTDVPHGLLLGDYVRFRDSSNVTQNHMTYRVVSVESPTSFKVADVNSGSGPSVSLASGSFVQPKPRFVPFQKLDQKQRCLDPNSGAASSIKILLFQKMSEGGCEAAWITASVVRLFKWVRPLRHNDPALSNSGNSAAFSPEFSPKEFRIPGLCVECACFLPSQYAMIALGCRVRSGAKTFTNELYIFEENQKVFRRVQVQGTLPALTSLNLLSADDGAELNERRAIPSDSFILVAATALTRFNESAFFLHVTRQEDEFKVKCFRSIHEIKSTGSTSKKSTTATPLRATHPTFISTDSIPIRSKPHNFRDAWLFFRNLSIRHCTATVRDSNSPLNLSQVRSGNSSTLWPVSDRKRLLDALKDEHNFIEFWQRVAPIQPHKVYSLVLDPSDPKRETTQFYVSTNGPKGNLLIRSLSPSDYLFRVAVPSDIDGEYGHESGIAKFVFLLDAPSLSRFGRAGLDQFREKSRLLAIPLRSWFPRLVQGKFGNNLQ